MYGAIAIKVNQSTDIDEKWDAALDEIAEDIAHESAVISHRTNNDKKYLYNAGHFALPGLDKRVYYVCAYNKNENSAELFFSHDDSLFRKAKADYDKSDGKVDPTVVQRPSGGMVN